jgi:hypothetical protein
MKQILMQILASHVNFASMDVKSRLINEILKGIYKDSNPTRTAVIALRTMTSRYEK